eukprot:m.232261 g.232261  ORF g.232261 m.232261 type:complete len:492 (+) comp12327_c0_seq1:38-1513(+)
MALLQRIIQDMRVDPELLDELTKEQKEMLFHKIREEQLRRWMAADRAVADDLGRKGPMVPKLRWEPYAEIWDDDISEQKAKAAAKRSEELAKQRERQEMEEDERQARVLAELEIQETLAKQRAAAEAAAETLRKQEEEARAALEAAAAKDRQDQIERETYMTMKEAKLAAEREAKARKEREEAAKKDAVKRQKELEKMEADARKAEQQAAKAIAAKSKEIYESMQTVRQQMKKHNKEEEARLESVWQQQERMAKQAEEEKRAAAAKARAEALEQQSRASFSIIPEDRAGALEALRERKAAEARQLAEQEEVVRRAREASRMPSERRSSNRVLQPGSVATLTPVVTAKMPAESRPPRPDNDQQVIDWWRTEEKPRGIGLGPDGRYARWFHGLISREDSEAMLTGQPLGAYLIRVSARIWGYTISFVDSDRYKHFLIDAVEGNYSVFGVEARAHPDLNTLIKFHENFPVSKTGVKLTKAIGEPNNRSLQPLIA